MYQSFHAPVHVHLFNPFRPPAMPAMPARRPPCPPCHARVRAMPPPAADEDLHFSACTRVTQQQQRAI